MPSWPVHIALAKKLNKKLNLGNDFIIGNVLPDVLNGHMIKEPSIILDHITTHYRNITINSIDEKFLKNYQKKLHNPIILGYFCHILTDDYFNNYFYQNHIIIKNNKRYCILNNNKEYYSKTLPSWRVKQLDFEIFGNKLTNQGLLGNPIDPKDINKNHIKEINDLKFTENDINKTIEKINCFILSKENFNENNYKIFKINELDQVYDDCYKYIINILKNIKIL